MKENNRTTMVPKKVGAETQYGNHVGYDAMEYQMMVTPDVSIGKPRGDNNRGNKGPKQGGGSYFGK